ncbi:hypothetical protein GGS21DRAFT_345067 [Xylaria nigripes]|nr:hypothetical protein GGS21DRAFT_345067 [Xylaria nigripes]
MKVIIADASGFLSDPVVLKAICAPNIHKVYVLSTYLPLYEYRSADIQYIRIPSFDNIPRHVQDEIQGSRACIWTIGAHEEDPVDFDDLNSARRHYVHNSTMAFARFCSQELAHDLRHQRKFRFVYCSERKAEWDSRIQHRFRNNIRHIHGENELGLFHLADINPDNFEVVVARPGGIKEQHGLLGNIFWQFRGIMELKDLARCLARLCNEEIPVDVKRVYSAKELKRL